MSLADEQIENLEDEFPMKAGKVFAEAREEALRSGHTVLVIRDGYLVRIHPGGTVANFEISGPGHQLEGESKISCYVNQPNHSLAVLGPTALNEGFILIFRRN